MSDFRVENTTLTDSPRTVSDEPFVYQHIRVQRLGLPELAAHIAVAAAAARALFGVEFRPDLRLTDSLCRQMLIRNRYPGDMASCIEMRLRASGDVTYRCGEIFLHEGLALRSVRPEAVTICYDLPFGEAPHSARLAAHAVAAAEAQRRGCRAVVRCNAQGMAATADDSPLFAVFGRRIVTPPAPASVERDRVVRAAAAAGYRLDEVPVGRSELARADELFYSDCRGITALASCDGRTYADIIARRVADAIQNSEFKIQN